MFVIKRKQLIIACVAVLVATAGYLNIMYGKDKEQAAAKETVGEIHLVEEEKATDFFEAARYDREISRSEAVETLSSIAENEKSEATSKAMAEEEMIKIAKHKETESTVESLIKSKGYEDAVVFMSDGSVSAVIKAASLTQQDATKICEIISKQTGVAPTAIKITQAQ